MNQFKLKNKDPLKKVCYIIFSQTDKSLGGHYRSLKSHYESFKNESIIDEKSFIVNFGKVFSPVLKGMESVFFFKTVNFGSFYRSIKLVRNEKPDIIHSYDMASYCLAKFISFYYGSIPIIHTKCGGPNLSNYSNVQTIFFSSENYEDFKRSHPKQKAYLIPNRVLRKKEKKEDEDILCLKELLKKKGTDINLLRINRISKKYESTMNQAVKLVQKLNNIGIQSKLFIIGTIEDKYVLEQIEHIDPNVVVLSKSEYTNNASKFIPLFNAIIGTGRGVMEGFSYSKPVLVPCENLKFPILVNQENFGQALFYNFSERLVIPNTHIDIEFEKILEKLTDKEENYKYTAEIFDKYFNIQTAASQYRTIYSELLNKPSEIPSLSISEKLYFLNKVIKSF